MSTREAFLLEREHLRSRSALCRLRLRRESRAARQSLRWPMALAAGAAVAAALVTSRRATPRVGAWSLFARLAVIAAGIVR
jgi:hypothetical protein